MGEVAERKKQAIRAAQSPDQFITQALSSNAPIETLEKLMDLKERYDAKQAHKAFVAAMQKFQQIKPELKRSSAVSFGQGKTAYNFCPLSEIEKQLKDPLSLCGLSYRFENMSREIQFGVRCIVTHLDGHSESTEMYAPADGSGNKNAIQGIGSTSTYLMRYTLIAAFALTTADEDNDGQSNSDLPLARVLTQNACLQDRNTLAAVSNIKEALFYDEYEAAASTFNAMLPEVRNSLWIAPTRGGIFTTEERAKIKSDQFSQALRESVAKENEQAA